MVMCRRPCGGVGGPCDFSVSPSPFGLDFGTLDFGTSDLGLTIKKSIVVRTLPLQNALGDLYSMSVSKKLSIYFQALLWACCFRLF